MDIFVLLGNYKYLYKKSYKDNYVIMIVGLATLVHIVYSTQSKFALVAQLVRASVL